MNDIHLGDKRTLFGLFRNLYRGFTVGNGVFLATRYIKIQIILKGINKIFTCGTQWTWDTACGQRVHTYISKTNRLKFNLHLRCATDMGYGRGQHVRAYKSITMFIYKSK